MFTVIDRLLLGFTEFLIGFTYLLVSLVFIGSTPRCSLNSHFIDQIELEKSFARLAPRFFLPSFTEFFFNNFFFGGRTQKKNRNNFLELGNRHDKTRQR